VMPMRPVSSRFVGVSIENSLIRAVRKNQSFSNPPRRNRPLRARRRACLLAGIALAREGMGAGIAPYCGWKGEPARKKSPGYSGG
jgi:hypothetical protein